MDSRFDEGMRVRTEVLGAEHVARAQAAQTPFDADFQRFITEYAWGALWARPHLDRRTRSLVTIAILAALGREELALHFRASRNLGVDPAEVAEVLLHVAVYAGVPAANHAFAVGRRELGFSEGAAPGGTAPGGTAPGGAASGGGASGGVEPGTAPGGTTGPPRRDQR
ncbi:MAG: 4-carboxymuconolactone decarboxylase [Armatimonadota bacterium]|nr:4-carboxymuconolactone decarboxylase [Armatimonadota bacterium]MDR7449609.1 4-carboxymuconolactone decarboxylase [Armatimonadota bacterium]MDR7460352.1 4-carboxymuconolactone decarboxylase [Armatimonadota bacterium]MDR7488085.1 4-carboxymuconolactone decarboxylase [Armatimonadota bacterium]MDR7492120.1 4-carboxymuconolactone decarboxylase [Armatimonadota bacterium]